MSSKLKLAKHKTETQMLRIKKMQKKVKKNLCEVSATSGMNRLNIT